MQNQHKEYIAFEGDKFTIEWYFDSRGTIMDGDDVSIRNLAKEANISKSVIQNLRSGKQNDIKVSNLTIAAFGLYLVCEFKYPAG